MPEPVSATSDARNIATDSDGPVLALRKLSKRYGGRLAVDLLSLSVRAGEVYGFLGPNGAGKTTTIRMCLGLIAPSGGAVEILGRAVATHAATVLPRVGALVEQPALYSYLSGRENLRVVADALGGVPAARIDEVLELVDLRARARDRVRTYSLGMKQRLGVALALVHSPDLVILDEPTNGLDPAGIVEMRALLRRLAERGKTVFISSHVLAEVQQICTRVAIIAAGRLVTESTVADLLRGGNEFVVVVERPHEALALVAAQPWGATAQLDSAQHLITPAPENASEALTLFLVNQGIVPRSIAPRQMELEDIFLRLTTPQDGPAKGANA